MRGVNMDEWRAAYRRELAHAYELRPEGPVETVFFGGGTPSLMTPALIVARPVWYPNNIGSGRCGGMAKPTCATEHAGARHVLARPPARRRISNR